MTAWAVVFTKPNHETRALINLGNQHFEVFLPQCQHAGKKRWRPLFPGYIFVDIEGRSIHPIRSTIGVLRLIANMDGRIGYVPVDVIADLQARHEAGIIIDDPVLEVPEGRVVVREGPFKDRKGMVVGSAENRISVMLDTMRYEVQFPWPSEALVQEN